MPLQKVEQAEDLIGTLEGGPEPAGGAGQEARGRPAHEVFVSYSSVNKPVADAIVSRLEQEGVRCWVAPRDVIPGQNFAEAILEAIETSRLMVVVLSSQANQSQHVPREVERAVHHNVVVIPFRIESVEPSGAMAYFLASEHWLDAMTPPLESHIGHLVQVVSNLLDRPPTPVHEEALVPAPAKRLGWLRGHRKWIVVAAVTLLLGAAGGLFAVRHTGSSSPPTVPSGSVPSGAVAQFTGTTDATTRNFTVGSPWKLTWTVYSSMDILPLVEIDTSTGDIVDTIDIAKPGSGSHVEQVGGTVHLKISVYGNSTYTFTVRNGK